MEQILSLFISTGLIGLVMWWFFGKKSTSAVANLNHGVQQVTIIAKGGYNPEIISFESGKPIELTFLRKDTSSCLEEVVIPDLGIQEKLPINKDIIIRISDPKPGVYNFSCGMRMFHGKIEVK